MARWERIQPAVLFSFWGHDMKPTRVNLYHGYLPATAAALGYLPKTEHRKTPCSCYRYCCR